MQTQHFFIGKEYFGSVERGRLQFGTGAGSYPLSAAFACPTCGDIWARFPVDGSPFVFHHIACERHSLGFWGPAGSVWLPWDDELTNAFPPALVRREFLLHLTKAEKELEIYDISEEQEGTAAAIT